MNPAWLDDSAWAAVQASVPIVCVDLVPFRTGAGAAEVGLVLRSTPFGDEPRWCHIGGRVGYGETVRAALLRHLHETVSGAELDLPADPQPSWVMQWFPDPVDPARDGVPYGWDPRRHAVALAFAVTLRGEPVAVPGGEGQRFDWFDAAELGQRGDALWPGTAALVDELRRRPALAPPSAAPR